MFVELFKSTANERCQTTTSFIEQSNKFSERFTAIRRSCVEWIEQARNKTSSTSPRILYGKTTKKKKTVEVILLCTRFFCSMKVNEIYGVLNVLEYIFCHVLMTEAIPPVAQTKKWLPKDAGNLCGVKSAH